MRKRYAFTVSLLIVFLFIIGGCGGSKYSDAKKVMQEQVDALKIYVSDIEKAEAAKDMVAAINTYNLKMKELIPEIRKMSEKFPELKNQEAVPEELKKLSAEIKEISGKLQGAMMKVMKYMQDPEVRNAIQEQGKVMMDLGKEQ
jgi:hypothetical protein